MDIWRDFDEWNRNIFGDYSRIESEMDRRFRDFSDLMLRNRERTREELRLGGGMRPFQSMLGYEGALAPKLSSELAKLPEMGLQPIVERHAYSKEQRSSETRTIQIGKYRMLYKLIDHVKERDGLKLPHLIRSVECHPATPLNLVIENSPFDEVLDEGVRNRLLSQFQLDTKNVDEKQKPHLILKYTNTVVTEDPSNLITGKIFGFKVTYLNKDNERYRYHYRKRQGEQNAQISIDRSTKLFSSFF